MLFSPLFLSSYSTLLPLILHCALAEGQCSFRRSRKLTLEGVNIGAAASDVCCPGIVHALDNGSKYSHFDSESCLCCHTAIGLDLFEHGKCFPKISQKVINFFFSWWYRHLDFYMICFYIEIISEEGKVLLCWEKELWSLPAHQL